MASVQMTGSITSNIDILDISYSNMASFISIRAEGTDYSDTPSGRTFTTNVSCNRKRKIYFTGNNVVVPVSVRTAYNSSSQYYNVTGAPEPPTASVNFVFNFGSDNYSFNGSNSTIIFDTEA